MAQKRKRPLKNEKPKQKNIAINSDGASYREPVLRRPRALKYPAEMAMIQLI
jgi:hypothetical protein